MNDTVELEGRTLAGRYRVVRLIGTGGMGSVYEGVQLGLERRVALKVLHSQHTENETSLARFRQEALAAARIAHPHIVQVSDFIASPDGSEPPFLVMEYVEGKNLRELVEEQGPLPLDRVARIASQVLEALAVAHAAGIIHRDIKPDNIVISTSPTLGDLAKVLDFGIAKVKNAPAAGSPQTEWGAVLGTLTYMPPEQARSETVDARSDLYAVGGCMYFAASGERPVDAARPGGLVMAILTDVPKPLQTRRPDVDRMFDDIVMRALRKSPLDRFVDADAMRAAIAEWRDASPEARARGLQLKMTTAAMPSTKPVSELARMLPEPTIIEGPHDLEPLSHTAPMGTKRPTFLSQRDSGIPASAPTSGTPGSGIPYSAPQSAGTMVSPHAGYASSPPPAMPQQHVSVPAPPPAPTSSPHSVSDALRPSGHGPSPSARRPDNEARTLTLVIGIAVVVIFMAVAIIIGAIVYMGATSSRKPTPEPIPTATTATMATTEPIAPPPPTASSVTPPPPPPPTTTTPPLATTSKKPPKKPPAPIF